MFLDLTRLLARTRPNPQPSDPGDGAVLGSTDQGLPVVLPHPTVERASHATVLAASGAGKTVMVGAALAAELVEHPELGIIAVDPKGDLCATFLPQLALHAPERLARVVYLDPFGGGFPFNLLHLPSTGVPIDIRATQLAQLVAEVSTATGAQRHLGAGARQMDALTNVLLGALTTARPGASILYALDALTMPKGLAALARVTDSPRARAFLQSANLSDELKASTAARLRAAFAATDALERLVAAPSCLDLRSLVAPGVVVVIDLGRPTGGLQSLQTFYANVLLRLVVETLMERPSPWSGHHTRIVVDEAQVVAPVLADVAERVLTTGRSRGMSLLTLSQGTTLIADASPTLLRVLLTNTATKIVGRLAAPDAELLVREQSTAPGVDEPVGRLRARLAAQVANLPDRHFLAFAPSGRLRFVSADVDLAAAAQAEQREREVLDQVRDRYALAANQEPRSILPREPERTRSRRDPDGAAPTGSPQHPAPPPRGRWG